MRLWQWLIRQPYLLLTIAMLCWAGNFVLGRAVRGAVPPVGLAFWRWLGGFLILLPFALPHLRREWGTIRQRWRILLVLTVLGIAVFNTLAYIGLQRTPAINGLLMQSTMPLMIIALSFLLFRETVTVRQAVGIALSLAGVAVIILQGDWRQLATFSFNPGDVLILLAVLSYSAYSVLLKRRPALHPLAFLGIMFAGGALLLLPFYVAESWGGFPMRPTPTTFFAVGYVSLLPSIVAYLCYNRGVALVGANRAGLFFHLMPLFGSLLAISLLGEQFRSYHLWGIGLIGAGILLATLRGPSKQATIAPSTPLR